jgi:hypothetical protein
VDNDPVVKVVLLDSLSTLAGTPVPRIPVLPPGISTLTVVPGR